MKYKNSTIAARACVSILSLSLSLYLSACAPSNEARASASSTANSSAFIRVENISPDQQITEGVPAFFRIAVSPEVRAVQVVANGAALGNAERTPGKSEFTFEHEFETVGAFDLEFVALSDSQTPRLATANYRVEIVPQAAPVASRYFNSYILKSVAFLNKNYGLLGYNLHAQMTHPVSYHKYGVLRPTKDGFTMCVSGVLEVMVTAFNIYAQEKGTYSHFDFLPFDSWNTLRNDSIKAHIWVNPKLKSAGTADAINKFGVGERIRFRDLEPGGFVNINRTTRSGHAVVFLSFINSKGEDVPKYGPSVVGFRYFGAQGRGIKGQGGLGYRHAFFSKYGCPDVPYKRDCKIIYSEDSRILNVGHMLHPSQWKRKPLFEQDGLDRRDPLSPQEQELVQDPKEFDGLTTDD